jgi:hypothetical protein
MKLPVPRQWQFDVQPETTIVTSTYVTIDRMPVLYVTHEHDPEEGPIWQFHCGNNDYDPAVLQLVSLKELLALDPSIEQVAQLPVGFCARRPSAQQQWRFEPDQG